MRSDIASSAGTFAQSFDLLADWRSQMGIAMNLPGLTIVRVRGALQWDYAAGPGAASGSLVGARVGQIPEPPDPTTGFPSVARHEDWMLFDWAPMSMGWSGGSVDPAVDVFSYTLDIKSKRRLDEPQETLWLVWEATRDTDTAEMYGWVSVLLALP